MASPGDIAEVRANTNEPNDVAPYTDAYIDGLVDAVGVTGATLTIWKQKLASFSSAVDVTEAGATHKFSSLFENALKMVKYWEGILAEENGLTGPRVKVIERTGL